MSWVGCLLKDSEPIILFAENSQILLKISVIPILVQLNSLLWHMIVTIKIKRDFKTWLFFNHCRRLGLKQSLLESMVFIFLVEFLGLIWWFFAIHLWPILLMIFMTILLRLFLTSFLTIFMTILHYSVFEHFWLDLLRILRIWFHYLQFFSCSFWCFWLHRQLPGYPSKCRIFWVIRAIC